MNSSFFLFFFNITICFFVSCIFCWIYLHKRYLFVKPSIWVILFLHLFLEYPLAFFDLIVLFTDQETILNFGAPTIEKIEGYFK
jgi:hypothetical protein